MTDLSIKKAAKFLLFCLVIFPFIYSNIAFQTLANEAVNEQLNRLNQDINALRQTNDRLKTKAQKLEQERQILRRDLITLAAELQDQESLIMRLDAQLDALQAELNDRETEIATRHDQIGSAMRFFAFHQDNSIMAMLLREDAPKDIVQGAMITAAILPQLSSRAKLLGQDLKALASLRSVIEEKMKILDEREVRLLQGKDRLEALVEKNLKNYRQANLQSKESQSKLNELVSKANSLQDLLNAVQASRKAFPSPSPSDQERINQRVSLPDVPEPLMPSSNQANNQESSQTASIDIARPDMIRPFPGRNGALATPVSGRLISRYGDENEIGTKSRGIELSARENAQVIAPYDGKVVFAGPFRAFGNVVILEHEGGYHSVIARLGTITVISEQWVLAGEPIGMVAQEDNGASPRLYVELRRQGQAVNPLPYYNKSLL